MREAEGPPRKFLDPPLAIYVHVCYLQHYILLYSFEILVTVVRHSNQEQRNTDINCRCNLPFSTVLCHSSLFSCYVTKYVCLHRLSVRGKCLLLTRHDSVLNAFRGLHNAVCITIRLKAAFQLVGVIILLLLYGVFQHASVTTNW